MFSDIFFAIRDSMETFSLVFVDGIILIIVRVFVLLCFVVFLLSIVHVGV